MSSVLLPAAWLYDAMSAIHRWTYAGGLRRSVRMPVPVIVVGNVIVGGAGKTPTVTGIIKHLQARGMRPGILSRGYGGHHSRPIPVLPDSLPAEVGDEPLLLRRAAGCPVVVGRDRVRAGQLLLQLHPELTHIVCDDGMQHYRLFRDLEVCVFDSRGLGNGRLLPAGMLRQRWPRQALEAAGQSAHRLMVVKTGPSEVQGFTATRVLHPIATNGFGAEITLEALQHSKKSLHALAGIAQPDNFFSMLRERGLELQGSQALPDHYDFNINWIHQHTAETLICTQKDAAKLWRHRPDAWAVALTQTLPDDFLAALDTALLSIHTPPVSSAHGHTTH